MREGTVARTTDSTTPARVRRSPQERAQADLDKAQKAVDRATERVTKAQAEWEAAQEDQKRAQRYLTYAQANPDLPAQAAEKEASPA